MNGLTQFWLQGDVVSKAIAILLLGMSALSWTAIVLKGWQLAHLKRMTLAAERQFWSAGSMDEGLSELGQASGNPYRALALAGASASEHRRSRQAQLQDQLDASEWLSRCLQSALDENIARLQGGLAVLGSIGSTAPFVGLLGTVWGIYHALMAIGTSGQAGLEQVAGPVGESLIMTAFGLFVAIPAVLGYNAIARGNRTVIHKMARFTHDLHAYFLTGSRLKRQAEPIVSKDAGAVGAAPRLVVR